MAFEQQSFRHALGLFDRSCRGHHDNRGWRKNCTSASSFNSVSLSPPLVLFSIARTAKSFGVG